MKFLRLLNTIVNLRRSIGYRDSSVYTSTEVSRATKILASA